MEVVVALERAVAACGYERREERSWARNVGGSIYRGTDLDVETVDEADLVVFDWSDSCS